MVGGSVGVWWAEAWACGQGHQRRERRKVSYCHVPVSPWRARGKGICGRASVWARDSVQQSGQELCVEKKDEKKRCVAMLIRST